MSSEVNYIYLEPKMTSVLIGKGLVLEGWSPKIEDKQVPGIVSSSFIYQCIADWRAGPYSKFTSNARLLTLLRALGFSPQVEKRRVRNETIGFWIYLMNQSNQWNFVILNVCYFKLCLGGYTHRVGTRLHSVFAQFGRRQEDELCHTLLLICCSQRLVSENLFIDARCRHTSQCRMLSISWVLRPLRPTRVFLDGTAGLSDPKRVLRPPFNHHTLPKKDCQASLTRAFVQDSKHLFHLLFFGVFCDYSDRWWLVDTIILDAHSGRARRLLCYRKLWKLMWIVVTLKNSLHCNFILNTCSQIVTFQISGKVHTCVESPETYPSMVLRVLVLLEAIEHCPKPA